MLGKQRKDRTPSIVPRPVFGLFPLPSGFLLPGASWRHLPGWVSRREEGQTGPAQRRSRAGEKAEPAGRGVQDQGGGWGERGEAPKACWRAALPPGVLGGPSLQTGYQPPGVCRRLCPRSVMHELCEVKPWWCARTSDPYI